MTIFSSKVQCAECGGWYGSKVWHSNDKYRRGIYQCNNKFRHKTGCSTPHLTEFEIKDYFVKAVNQLIMEKAEILDNLQLIRTTLCDKADLIKQKEALEEKINVTVEMTQNIVAENARMAQNQDEYNKKYSSLVERYNKLKEEYDSICSPQSAVLSAIIYNALIIVALIPLALKGVKYREVSSGKLLTQNLLIYGLGGIVTPFVCIKIIDVLLTVMGLV